MSFDAWLDTFIEEKELDLDHVFEVYTEGPWRYHHIPLEVVVLHMKAGHPKVQDVMKDTLIYIDSKNGDAMEYFEFCARVLAQRMEEGQSA